MKFTLTIKLSQMPLCQLEGIDRQRETVTIAEMENVIKLEQDLERLFGYRFHIGTKDEDN